MNSGVLSFDLKQGDRIYIYPIYIKTKKDIPLRKYLHYKEQCKREIVKIAKVFNTLDGTGSGCEKALELPMTDYEGALPAA